MTPTQFCQLVETRLGWCPPDIDEPWKRYIAEAAKVKRRRAKDPHKYTWRNLRLAVELCQRKGLTRSPVGVFAYVDQAIAKAVELPDDLDAQIDRAVAAELGHGDPDGFADRMARARGDYRAQLYREWRAR